MSTAAAATRQALSPPAFITKHYGHVQALRGVDLDSYPGEVLGTRW
jgi:ABC-type sugar transport system ATPase subunit